MYRAAQLLAGQSDRPEQGWGNDLLFPDRWTDCLRPLSYDDPALVDRESVRRNFLVGLWSGFSKSVQEQRAKRNLAPATYYAEKSEPQIAEAISRQIDCRIIFVIRDPRDVFLSSKQFNQKRGNFEYGWNKDADVRELIHWQIERVREDLKRFDELRSSGVDARLLRYEDMITQPDQFKTEIETWLGVSLDREALHTEAIEHGSRHLTSSSVGASTERWRAELPRNLARLYVKFAGDLLDRFAYGR